MPTLISTDPYREDSNSILNHILNIDEGVFKRLMDVTESKVDYETSMKVLTLLTSKRVLDTMPTPAKSEKDIGMKSGVKEYFKVRYNANKGEDDEEVAGYIVLSGTKLKTDFNVIRTLKALIKTGRSKNEKISIATTRLVKDIIQKIAESGYYTTNKMCEDLNYTSYYEKELAKAVREVYGFAKNRESED